MDFGESENRNRIMVDIEEATSAYYKYEYKRALDICSKYDSCNPAIPTFALTKHLVYQCFDNPTGSLRELKRLFQAEPSLSNALMLLNVLDRLGDSGQTKTTYEELHTPSAQQIESWNHIRDLFELRDPERTHAAYQRIQSDPRVSGEIKKDLWLIHTRIVYLSGTTRAPTPKEEFRQFCAYYTPLIRQSPLPGILTGQKYEAVFIEFRTLPHTEFLIRNAILKLTTDWSHTVICGKRNLNTMLEMCARIHPNIRVICLPFDNLTPEQYSLLLADRHFWEQLRGEQILIYQEDTCIFGTDIREFLRWDYIGAPWPVWVVSNARGVGNGGFSLRSRSAMLRVINRVSLFDTHYAQPYAPGQVPPEDVYFANNMIQFELGKVADRDTAHRFSVETNRNQDAFGGHCFFNHDPDWMTLMYRRVIREYNSISLLSNTKLNPFNNAIIKSTKNAQFPV